MWGSNLADGPAHPQQGMSIAILEYKYYSPFFWLYCGCSRWPLTCSRKNTKNWIFQQIKLWDCFQLPDEHANIFALNSKYCESTVNFFDDFKFEESWSWSFKSVFFISLTQQKAAFQKQLWTAKSTSFWLLSTPLSLSLIFDTSSSLSSSKCS